MLDKLRQNEGVRLAAVTAALALLALVPLLGQFGFWDPQEITVADRARSLTQGGGYLALWKTQLPLTPWLVAVSTATFGRSELAARLPLALLGIVAALATYGLGARLRRPRAGLYAAIALLASPLFVFQARQLISDAGAIAGGALAMLGLAGVLWPASSARRPLLVALDAAAIAAGLLLGLFSAGLLVGVIVPIAAAAAATLPFSSSRPAPRRGGAILLGALTLLLGLVVLVMIFDIGDAQPGARGLLGKTLIGAREYLPWLGGTWRNGEAPVTSTFDWIITQVAFGMFPWSAVAPIAVLRLMLVRDRDRQAWGGVLIVAWATVAYLLSSLWVRGFGDLRFPALPALALAVGIFLDDLLAAKVDGTSRAPEATSGFPVAAVFIFIAGFILSLDLRNFPEKLASVHIIGSEVKLPHEVVWLAFGAIFFGIVVAAATAIGVYVAGGDGETLRVPRKTLVRSAILGAVAASYGFSLFLSWVYTPKVSQHFSYKNLFEAYFEHRRDSEPLAVMGIPGSGPEYYARGRFERIDNLTRLLQFLGESERAFAVIPSDRLCSLHQSNTQLKVPFKVIDTRNSRFYLLSNQLAGNEKDLSPIASAFHREPPASMSRKVEANFEDVVELLGVDMPDAVEKGSEFKLTLWFRVKKRFPSSQKIFLHFDLGQIRFQGDHDPVACNTQFWQPGDVVSDTYTVTAGEITSPRGSYQVFAGFFTGGGGQWKNMTVLTPNKDSNNRVLLGNIRVR